MRTVHGGFHRRAVVCAHMLRCRHICMHVLTHAWCVCARACLHSTRCTTRYICLTTWPWPSLCTPRDDPHLQLRVCAVQVCGGSWLRTSGQASVRATNRLGARAHLHDKMDVAEPPESRDGCRKCQHGDLPRRRQTCARDEQADKPHV